MDAIRNEFEYRDALKVAERLMGAAPGSPEGDRLIALVALIEAYEAKHFPLGVPNSTRQTR